MVNTAGQPVVTLTSISSTAFNALTNDLAVGLSTCLLKDGTQTTTAVINFAAGLSVPDNVLSIKDNADPTKIIQFQASAITGGNTRTYTMPDVSDTVVTLTATQTLTNKTLPSPTITTGSFSGTSTFSGAAVFNAGASYVLSQNGQTALVSQNTNAGASALATLNLVSNAGTSQVFASSSASTFAGDTGFTTPVSTGFQWLIGAGQTLRLASTGLNLASSTSYSINGTALPIQRKSSIADQVITSAGALTLAHGLTNVETVDAQLVNQTGEAGYTAGQVTPTPLGALITTGTGLSILWDATNITVRFSSTANAFIAPHATTGVPTALTNVNWKLRLIARGT